MAPGASTLGRPKKKLTEGEQPPVVANVAIRSTLEWIAWLDRVVEHCRVDRSKLIDTALVFYARSQGFTEPPPKRTP
jgi:hypothetical protein